MRGGGIQYKCKKTIAMDIGNEIQNSNKELHIISEECLVAMSYLNDKLEAVRGRLVEVKKQANLMGSEIYVSEIDSLIEKIDSIVHACKKRTSE